MDYLVHNTWFLKVQLFVVNFESLGFKATVGYFEFDRNT